MPAPGIPTSESFCLKQIPIFYKYFFVQLFAVIFLMCLQIFLTKKGKYLRSLKFIIFKRPFFDAVYDSFCF